MTFTIDYDKAKQGFTLVDPGKYECVLTDVEKTVAKTGTIGYKLHVVIRDDVDQPFSGWTFDQTLWTKRDTGQLNGGLLNAMARAMQLENGKSYKSMEDLFVDMILKPFIGEIVIDEQEYGTEGKIWRSNRIQKWHATGKPDMHIGGAATQNAGFFPVDESDVPF